MKIRLILLSIMTLFIMAGCHNNDYAPKPQAYLRIDMPKAEYSLCDTVMLPFIFEKNDMVKLTMKKRTKRDVWVDLEYSQWKGVVFLSYKHIKSLDDLRGQIDTSVRLLEKHHLFTSGIDEKGYENSEKHVYGSAFLLKGRNVASTYQFWVTDSTRNFLRGALYVNSTPNNDSLAPVLEYMQNDVKHLVETLVWRE